MADSILLIDDDVAISPDPASANAVPTAGPIRIAFVGDRLYTDVRMANEHGFTAVLTLTGETTHGDHGSSYAPDLVVRDLYELAQHLGLARMEERSA